MRSVQSLCVCRSLSICDLAGWLGWLAGLARWYGLYPPRLYLVKDSQRQRRPDDKHGVNLCKICHRRNKIGAVQKGRVAVDVVCSVV